MKVLILSGPSGSGKSTWAKNRASLTRGTRIFSADDYMITDGEYVFDINKISEAHPWCFRRFLDALNKCEQGHGGYGQELFIVDNTNTSSAEIAPYYLAAQAFGFEVEIIRFEGDIHPNVHNTPKMIVAAQRARFDAKDVMPWWNVTTA